MRPRPNGLREKIYNIQMHLNGELTDITLLFFSNKSDIILIQ